MSIEGSATAQRMRTPDPEGLLYGAILSASVLATASAHVEEFTNIALAALVVLGVYWLAHLYVAAQTRAFEGDTRQILHRVVESGREESAVLAGGLPAIVVFLIGDLLGLTTAKAAALAVYFSVALLVCVGYLVARRAGRRGLGAVLDASVAGLFGVVVVVAKTLLH